MQANGENSAEQGSRIIRPILDETPLRAASFIVTIYGDVVEPRGGAIWIGNLIEICAGVGISETLVRTAVSRLVAAGQLAGEREGRRSFYRLTDAARAEFAAAARVIFGPPEEASWHFVQLMGSSAEERMQMLERSGHARLGPRLAVGVRPFPSAIMPAVVFRAEPAQGASELKAFASGCWDLGPHAQAYRRFLACFGKLAVLPDTARAIAPAECLSARLLMVHQFRFVTLREPRLPAEILPADWPGDEARRLFARLYRSLSPQADLHVARNCVTLTGPLPKATGATEHRLRMLCGEAAPGKSGNPF
ncbi:phenylacetic acid degradation operon negative regulatory protein PaaX (plasmid) [Sinorhizobium meliloti]|uniref:phenylacetic acid degradation operon negative regulatory protein PaaX n=1 Tax=Rhizobium meliloti TaxID=382 RepID=UPI000FDA479F|nr:phenylacetic acid degradation operon negative regulatory protein PaaX [Sinorhizobium meliloti]MDW9625937.1 phenylacetic acid degradation operon negative regulatory protein PaaX [Sinorhizobium meliloti]MDW9996645.1 phenylacetic acid degradation operon negative regulatory protein PaaX [Sinorhizobium meliloti]RVK13816.1 phenylacetic acid degradation operon negative regulatory protein PaaX [Sinorhizobium meliloti]